MAQRMPRVVREHEVLRVAGWMPGEDATGVAHSAIQEVLRWAERRCGGRLPPEAWRQESFEYLSGGRNSSCVRLQSENSDLWAIRADDPDKNVAERVWTTEVVVGLVPRQPARFSARLLVSTPEHELDVEPHTPGLVQQVAEHCTLAAGKYPLSPEPVAITTAEDADELVEQLIDPARKLPVFVVTLPAENFSHHPTLDAGALARAMLGLAHVALVHPQATWGLTNRFGKFRSVFGGAARVYLPGFTEDADPFSHRLVLADQLASADGAARCERWIRQLAAHESVRRTRLGQDVVPFASIRNASLELRQRALESEGASDAEQLAAANDRITALERQLAQVGTEQDYYIAEYERERNRAELAEAQSQKSAYRVQELTRILKAKGADPDENIPLPGTWAELPDWCDEHLAGRLVLTPAAHRGARDPLFTDVAAAARCLLWLATICRDQRIEGGDGTLRDVPVEDGIRNAACGSDTYDFDWNGRRLSADWHVKNGGNTRDPARCLRIYYCFDQQTQQIIVSDLPAHRRTGAT
jgi:hypothetical protein